MTLVDQIPYSPPAAGPNRCGNAVHGEYVCFVCGFRILSCGALPDCPTCHQNAWQLVAWRPFSGGGVDHPPFADPHHGP